MKNIFFAIIISFSAFITPVHAQNDGSQDAQIMKEETDFVAGSDVTLKTFDESETELSDKEKMAKEAEITIVEDKYSDKYVDASVQNISKLYWKKDALSLDSEEAIDNFILINECDIHDKFYDDDFEWLRVRAAAKEMLAEKKDGFPHKFKMVVPIDLGRYDMKRKGFPLINKTAFKDLRRVEIGGNSNYESLCGNDGVIKHYPRNLILILNKPFSYEFVQLDEHIAQAYIVRGKYNEVHKPREIENKHFDRLAFARIRITFADYQGETKGPNSFPLAIMFGQLDGIDIFEDAEETRLLTSVDYK